MLRIAQVIATLAPSHGGPSFVAMGMSRALARRGHKVLLLTSDRAGEAPAAGSLAADGVDYRLFRERFPRSFAYSPGLSKAVFELAPQLDLIHIHGLYLHSTIAAGRAGLRHNVPYIVRPAGSLDPYHVGRKRLKKALFNSLIHDRIMRGAAALHFTTKVEEEISQPHALGRPGIVVPNGLDLPPSRGSLASGMLRRRFPEIGDRKIVLFLGRVNYKKGFEVLIPAFAQILKERDDVHLVIAGNDDGYMSKTEQLITEFDVSRRVTLAGFMGGHEKQEALVDASIFVLPSYSENFANAAFEALAAGVPAIISNKVNSWPEIQEAGAAVVVEPEVSELTAALTSLLDNRPRREEMAARAEAFVRRNYSWDSVAEKLEAEYDAIISRRESST